MSDAPERIFYQPGFQQAFLPVLPAERSEIPAVEYVRSDLHAAAIARAEAAEAALAVARTDADELRVALRKAEAALAEIRSMIDPPPPDTWSTALAVRTMSRKIAALKGGAE